MGAHCTHTDLKHVLTIGGCAIWGGKESQVLPRAGEFDVVISLLGRVQATCTKFTLSRGSRRVFAQLAEYQQRRNNVLCIDWPDMSAPALDRAFWEALAEDLRKVQGKAVLYCMGGHGRTGTALCALAHVSQYNPALASGDVVQWVRETYCQDAVETSSQIEYLQRVIGASTKTTAWRGPTTWDRGRSALSHYLDLPEGDDDFHFRDVK